MAASQNRDSKDQQLRQKMLCCFSFLPAQELIRKERWDIGITEHEFIDLLSKFSKIENSKTPQGYGQYYICYSHSKSDFYKEDHAYVMPN